MTATLEDILTDIAARITPVTGIGQVYDREPDSITPPCAVVGLPGGDFIAYDPSMHSEACDYLLAVTLYVPAADMPSGQKALFPLLRPSGATSVRAAIAGYSQPLGVSYTVGQATNLRQVVVDSARYVSCDITVRVTA
jgi:hypothetical protein